MRETSDRVSAVIASRLARLSGTAAELAGVAATASSPLRSSPAPLARARTGSSAASTSCGERRSCARGPNAYDFSHGKIREAAYGALSPAAARHHLRVANALQRSQPDDLDTASGQVAAHYEAAGAVDDAIAWHMRAAEAAQRLYASPDAARSLERALRLIGELPAGIERDTLELRLLTKLPARCSRSRATSQAGSPRFTSARASAGALGVPRATVDPLAGAREPGSRRLRRRARVRRAASNSW